MDQRQETKDESQTENISYIEVGKSMLRNISLSFIPGICEYNFMKNSIRSAKGDPMMGTGQTIVASGFLSLCTIVLTGVIGYDCVHNLFEARNHSNLGDDLQIYSLFKTYIGLASSHIEFSARNYKEKK